MANSTTSSAVCRITREISHLQKSDNLSLAVAFRDEDVRCVRAVIVGPPDTPYQFGFFEFSLKFGDNYPINSPSVTCMTTNRGRCRFNPNIYADGKVCLSILGTWRAESGEEWSSAQGLESILLSIQSLMGSHPYENEPGFEHSKKEDPDAQAYIAKIRHETLRITVIQRLERLLGISVDEVKQPPRKKARFSTPHVHNDDAAMSPTDSNDESEQEGVRESAESSTSAVSSDVHSKPSLDAVESKRKTKRWDPFADMIKDRFMWYFDTYMKTTEIHASEQKEGKFFECTEFEYPTNAMTGRFLYANLRQRLVKIRLALEAERRAWEIEGRSLGQKDGHIAHQLFFQHRQLQRDWNERPLNGSRIELSLRNEDCPSVWVLTLFGQPMTSLDGGIFRIILEIPPNFPQRQPHATFQTPIFHHRVSQMTGTVFYLANKTEELRSHLEGIVAAIDDCDTTFDPRVMVSPEAFAMYWGGDESRRKYNRRLRQSARESLEHTEQ